MPKKLVHSRLLNSSTHCVIGVAGGFCHTCLAELASDLRTFRTRRQTLYGTFDWTRHFWEVGHCSVKLTKVLLTCSLVHYSQPDPNRSKGCWSCKVCRSFVDRPSGRRIFWVRILICVTRRIRLCPTSFASISTGPETFECRSKFSTVDQSTVRVLDQATGQQYFGQPKLQRTEHALL